MTNADERYASALRDLSDALDPQGIHWAVTGAVAANNYRDQIRTTTDLDVILTLADNDIEDVQDALRQRGGPPRSSRISSSGHNTRSAEGWMWW